MRVAFLTNMPSPYRVKFFNELGKLCELTVIYELHNAKDRNANWTSEFAVNFKEIFLNSFVIHNGIAYSPSICKELKKYSFDLVVLGSYISPTHQKAKRYLLKNKIPFIINSDGTFLKKESFIKIFLKKKLIFGANAYITTCENAIKTFEHYKIINNLFKYHFSSIAQSQVVSKKTFPNNNRLTVISVGSFIPRKGNDVVLKAAKHLPDYDFVFVGGEPTDEYLKIIKDLNLRNVKFINHVGEKNLTNLYYSSDVFVLMTREDVWGLVINEAMAAGLPVITTNMCNAGIEMVKDDYNGYILPINEVDYLVNKLTELKNKEKRETMAYHSIEVAKNYTIERMALDHFTIFKKVIG